MNANRKAFLDAIAWAEGTAGLGDDAFVGTGGLHMLSGDCYITIGVGNPTREGNREKLEAAGRLVLAKLQH